MSTRRLPVHTLLLLLLVAAVAAGFLLVETYTPLYRHVPGTDSGVFLYVGQRILAGDVPYRDVWDHKLPAVHYLNALGLWLGHGSLWGLWFIEWFSLTLALLASLDVLRRMFGTGPALFGTAIWLLSLPPLFEGGNLTEEYVLPLQFLALGLFSRTVAGPRRHRYGLLTGVTGALAFLLRPNLIGVWLAAGLVACLLIGLRQQARGWLTFLLAAVGGGVTVLALVGGAFALSGALDDLIDAGLIFNFAYTSASMGQRVQSLRFLLDSLAPSGILALGLAGWLGGVVALTRRDTRQGYLAPFLRVALLALPLEILLAGVSGREYTHYAMPVLPVLGVWAAYFAARVLDRLPAETIFTWPRAQLSEQVLWPVALIAALALIPGIDAAYRAKAIVTGEAKHNTLHAVATYIEQKTQPDDYVLIWGHDVGLNAITETRSPTRFAYQLPLYTTGYQSPDMLAAFLDDLQARPPVLIVDASPSSGGYIPPLDATRRATWTPDPALPVTVLPETQTVFDYLAEHYELVVTVGADKWDIYRWKD